MRCAVDRGLDDPRERCGSRSIARRLEKHRIGWEQIAAILADVLEGFGDECRGRGEPILAGAADIGNWGRLLRGDGTCLQPRRLVEDLADQKRLGTRRSDDRRPNRSEGDAARCDAVSVEPHHRCRVHDRDRLCAPQAQRDVVAAASGVETRHPNAGDHLVGLEHGLPHPKVKLADGHLAGTAARPDQDDRVEGDQRRDGVICWGCGHDVADDRRPRSQLRGTDHPACLGEWKDPAAASGMAQNIVVGHQCPERDHAIALADLLQAGNPCEVDHVRVAADTARVLDHEIGAPSDETGFMPERRFQCERLVKGLGLMESGPTGHRCTPWWLPTRHRAGVVHVGRIMWPRR